MLGSFPQRHPVVLTAITAKAVKKSPMDLRATISSALPSGEKTQRQPPAQLYYACGGKSKALMLYDTFLAKLISGPKKSRARRMVIHPFEVSMFSRPSL